MFPEILMSRLSVIKPLHEFLEEKNLSFQAYVPVNLNVKVKC